MKLFFIQNDGNYLEYELPEVDIWIGRDESNEIILQDEMISRKHAVIKYQNGDWYLFDNNSSNGVFVDNRRIDAVPYKLQIGGMIQIGTHKISVGTPPIIEKKNKQEKIVISFDEEQDAEPQKLPPPLSQASSTPPPLPEKVTIDPSLFSSEVDKRSSITKSPNPSTKKRSPRLRRLFSDAALMETTFLNFDLINIKDIQGAPPETYIIEYFVKGISAFDNNKLTYSTYHMVEIKLTREYPRQSPKCKMLTPIFHPNIDPTVICVGDHWTAQERLVDLVIRIGEIITYQAHNIKSPLNGEAAQWTDMNIDKLPIDKRSLFPPELD